MKNKIYWSKRYLRIREDNFKHAEDTEKQIKINYLQAMQKIKNEILALYDKYAENNTMTFTEARQQLNKAELREFRWNLKIYQQIARRNNMRERFIKELKNASIRERLTRQQMLYVKMSLFLEELAVNTQTLLQDELLKTYKRTYKQSIMLHPDYVKPMTQTIPEAQIRAIINNKWCIDDLALTDRVWRDKEYTQRKLQLTLQQSFLLQEDTTTISEKFAKIMKVSFYKAQRLVETETAYIQEKANYDAMVKLGTKKYKILAVLDKKTSETCRHLDGKVLDIKDFKIGITAPPFHPYCRTTTIPYLEDEILDESTRTARDDKGKSQFIKNMNYKEWHQNKN